MRRVGIIGGGAAGIGAAYTLLRAGCDVTLFEARDQLEAGGMYRYCEAFSRWSQSAGGRLLRSRRVVSVWRESAAVRIRTVDSAGLPASFDVDDVALAAQPDQAIGLLDDATAAERILASIFDSRPLRLVTHRDRRLMPRDPESWSAYNFLVRSPGETPHRPTMTTYLNRLMGLADDVPDVFVTLNPYLEPDPDRVLDDRQLMQPKAGPRARETAQLVEQIQGRRRTWFCGSYFRAPFLHEQALASGFDIANRILDRQSTLVDDRRAAPALAVA